jgi:hypothetical protein
MTEITPDQINLMKKIALIVDNEVADIIYTDERFSSILLSNPIGVDVTDRIQNESIMVGYIYNAELDNFSEQ